MTSDALAQAPGPVSPRRFPGSLTLLCLVFAPLLPLAAKEPPPRVRVPLFAGISDDIATWNHATRLVLRDFWAQKGGPPEPTEVLLLDTGRSLRVKFLIEDADVRSLPDRGHDGDTFRDDCVELFFARPDKFVEEGIGLEINAAGTVSDMRVRNPQELDFTWNSGAVPAERNPDAEVRFTIRQVPTLLPLGRTATGAGWIFEIEIPWNYLHRELGMTGPAEAHPSRIRANFARWNHGAPGRIFTIWADSGLAVPKPHEPSRYGWLILETTAHP